MQIRDSVALITGGSRGIGAACAAEFRRRGARVALAARSREKLEAVAAAGDLILAGDVTDAEFRCHAVEETVARFGRIDILVNNAGIGLYAPSWCAPMEDIRAMVELNLMAAIGMIQEAVPYMRKQRRGLIVNVGSMAGKVTLPWLTLYSATKYALGSLTDGLRMELAPDGVGAMLVCPGYVKTEFQEHVLGGRPPERIRTAKEFLITPERCAVDIAEGVERGARTVVTPGTGWWLVALARLAPRLVDSQLARLYHSL